MGDHRTAAELVQEARRLCRDTPDVWLEDGCTDCLYVETTDGAERLCDMVEPDIRDAQLAR